jgi:PKD repeat protein
MDNFDKIIQQKVEQFEVPFNEAHWAQLEGKLNTIRATKIRNTIVGSVAGATIIAAISYFSFSQKQTTISKETAISVNSLPKEIAPKNNNNTNKANAISTEKEIKNAPSKTKDNSSTINPHILQEEKNNPTTIKNPIAPQENLSEHIAHTNPPKAEPLNAEFIVFNNKVCLGEEVYFEAQKNKHGVSYTWNFGDGTISHEKNPAHSYKNSQIYSVSLTLLNRETGEETTTIQNDIVNIMPKPSANFNFSETSVNHDDNKLKYPYTTFNASKINKECSYNWNFGNGQHNNASQGKTIYKNRGNYSATLTVKNNNTGCYASKEQKVLIKNGFDLFAQNAIRPFSDIIENKVFIPRALLAWDTKFEMLILDKSGKTIFTSTDSDKPWNGRVNNVGEVLPEGIFLWQVITYDVENNSHHHHGKITLVK